MAGVQITLSVKDDGTATIRRVSGEMDNLTRTTRNAADTQTGLLQTVKTHWLGLTAAAAGATLAINRVWNAAKRGAEFEESQGRLAKQLRGTRDSVDTLVPSMQRLVNGQLSLAEATKIASRGLAAGLNPDQLRTFAQLGDVVGDVMGTSIPEAMEQMIASLATGRTQIFAQVGLMIRLEDELRRVSAETGRSTESFSILERQQIAVNAVMREAPGFLARYGDQAVSDADKLAKLSAILDDVQTNLGRIASRTVAGAVRIGEGLFQGLPAQLAELEAATDPSLIDAQATALGQQAIQRRRNAARALRLETEAIESQLAKRREEVQLIQAISREETRRTAELQAQAVIIGRLNQAISAQRGIIAAARSGSESIEDLLFQRRLGEFTPEEQLQVLRNRALEFANDPNALVKIAQQIASLGDQPEIDMAIRAIGDMLPSAAARAESNLRELTAQIDAQNGSLKSVVATHDLLRRNFEDPLRLDFIGDQQLAAALDMLTQKANELRAAIVGGLPGISPTQFPTPIGPLPGGGDLGGFQAGSRFTRRGMALLHEGEAIIPAHKNFLSPGLSRDERAERLASVAAGLFRSFQSGTPFVSIGNIGQPFPGAFGPGELGGGSGRGSFSFLEGLDLLRTGGRIRIPNFTSPDELVRFLEGKIAQLRNERDEFAFRTRAENTLGTLSINRAFAETQTAQNAFIGLESQLTSALFSARQAVKRGASGFSGGMGSGSEIVINLVVDGRTLTRQVVRPELRRMQVMER